MKEHWKKTSTSIKIIENKAIKIIETHIYKDQ
jgi:hypothetical protein